MKDVSSAGETQVRRHTGRPLFTAFVVGLAVGIAGTLTVPDLVRPSLSRIFSLESVPLAGVVSRKQAETDRLLLTLSTPDGTILATFTREVAEVGLLIQEGDSVTLELREYAPFVDDPTIARVVPAPRPSGTPRAEGAEANETSLGAGRAGAGGGAPRPDTGAFGPDTTGGPRGG